MDRDARKPWITSLSASRAKGFCCMVWGSPRMCMRIRGTRVRAEISAMRRSYFRPLTSLMSSAPLSMAFATISLLRVSTEMGIFRRVRNAANTGARRLHSSSALMPREPGRGDSAPMSIKPAPSRSICKACCTAFSCEKKFPPSEKLSGVTFKTPMTRVRGPRMRVRERSFRRNLRRGIIKWQCNAKAAAGVQMSASTGAWCGAGELIQIDVAYWLPCRGVLGFLHSFFEFFGEDVFFVVFQVPRAAEFIFAIALLLIQNAGGVGEDDVWAGFGGGFMGKHGAEYRVDYHFRVAAWASDIQVVYILLGHGKYSTPFWRVVRSSDGNAVQWSEYAGPTILPAF